MIEFLKLNKLPVDTLVAGQHMTPQLNHWIMILFFCCISDCEDCRKIFWARNDLVTPMVTLVAGKQNPSAKSLVLRTRI